MSQGKPLDTLFHLVHAVKRQLHDQASSLDVDLAPMHIRVIKIIERQKPCNAIDVANYLGRDKAQVTRLISTLIEKGLIVKRPNLEDRRSQYLSVTEDGEVLVKTLAQFDKNIMDIMTSKLKQPEIDEFERVAKAMISNLKQSV